jgi:hypothetical protein
MMASENSPSPLRGNQLDRVRYEKIVMKKKVSVKMPRGKRLSYVLFPTAAVSGGEGPMAPLLPAIPKTVVWKCCRRSITQADRVVE